MNHGKADKYKDEMVKHAPDMAETIDGATQGASLFLDPTGSEVGDKVVGEEGIAYGDLNLNECVEPKQFHDVVGYYQRFDVFDMRVNRRRQGAETSFQSEVEMARDAVAEAPRENTSPIVEARAGLGGLKVL
jgi:nitrilase